MLTWIPPFFLACNSRYLWNCIAGLCAKLRFEKVLHLYSNGGSMRMILSSPIEYVIPSLGGILFLITFVSYVEDISILLLL